MCSKDTACQIICNLERTLFSKESKAVYIYIVIWRGSNLSVVKDETNSFYNAVLSTNIIDLEMSGLQVLKGKSVCQWKKK